MSDKEFTIRNYYEREIPIDDGVNGETTGELLPIRVRRFSVAQLQEFQRGFERAMNPTSERFIFRKPDSDEQERRELPEPKGAWEFAIPDSEIRRRRLEEMPPETRDRYEQQRQEDDDFMTSFCSKAIAEHVWPAPSVKLKIAREDGSTAPVTDGAGLVEAFGGNLSMLIRITHAINLENTMGADQKKALRLRLASNASSPTPGRAADPDGPKPDATATPADNSGSARNATASVAPDQSPSGSDGLVM